MVTNRRDALGGRLPLREPSTLKGQQREMYDSIIRDQAPWGRRAGFKMVTKEGGLIGPFNSFLLNPEITRALLAFDAALKNHVSFSERVREAIIIAVGGVWASKYELYSHSILGQNAGLSPEVIQSLASGELPEGLAPEELLAARIARNMATIHRIDDDLYEEAEQTFGSRACMRLQPSSASSV